MPGLSETRFFETDIWLWLASAAVLLAAALLVLRRLPGRFLSKLGYSLSPEATWRRVLMESSSDPMLLVSQSARILEANQNACDLAGWTQAELLGQPLKILVAASDHRIVEQACRRMPAARTQTHYVLVENRQHEMIRTEWRWVPATRNEFYIALRDLRAATPLEAPLEPSEELSALNRVSLAVSQLISLESVLRHAIVESMKVIGCDVGVICFIDRDNRRVTLAAQQGLPEERLREAVESVPLSGHPLSQHLLQTREIMHYRSLSRAPLPARLLAVLQDEDVHALIVIPIVSKGRVLGQLELGVQRPHSFLNVNTAVLRAIGEQVGMAIENAQLIEQVTEKAIHLQHVLDSSPAAILVVSYLPQGEMVTLANQRFGLLFGLSPQSLLQKPFEQVAPTLATSFDRDADFEGRWARLQKARELEGRGELKLAGPKPRVLDHYTRPVFDDFKQVVGRIWVFTDITEQKALAEGLRQAQKLESVGTLAAGIAHDFKNLLGAVAGNLSLLRESAGDSRAVQQSLANVESAVASGVDMCQSLLAFGRKAPTQLTPMHVGEVVERAARLLKSSLPSGVQLQIEIAQDAQPVEADGTQLLQVVMNLVINARDAMPKGGRITVRVSTREMSEADCASHAEARPGRFTVLAVEDTGQGMSPELMKQIFDPFFTTKSGAKGTGLGLAMVYGIAKSHNGWVQVESHVGVGSSFEIFLPTTEKTVVADETLSRQGGSGAGEPRGGEAVDAAASGGGRTILVADDDPMLLELTRTFLEGGGYKVLTASTGQQAVELYRAHGSEVALLILDMIMPDGGGAECLERIRAIQPTVKAMFLTGHSPDDLGEEVARLGALRVLGKPLGRAALMEAVRSALAPPAAT